MQKSVLILGLALLIGLAADTLLKSTWTAVLPSGVGIPLFIDILAVVTVALACNSKMPLGRKGLYFLLPAVIFGGGFAFVDSPILLSIDFWVVFLSLTFTAVSLTGHSLTTSGIVNYLLNIANGVVIPMVNGVDLVCNYIKWDQLLPPEGAKHARAVFRGLLIGLPITAIFFGLFVSADAAFAAIAGNAIKLDPFALAIDAIIVGAATWLSAGFFHTFTLSPMAQSARENLAEALPATTSEMPPQAGPRLGITEVTIALGLVNLLFFSFVCVQIKYLFGGASLVNLTPGLSYAEYARKGFFDLNIAVELVLPMLLATDFMLTKSSKAAIITFRVLAVTLVGLLGVVMASALMRMHLYQTEYGQSELRLYTTAFMGWLATVCVIFCGTVITGLRQYFAFGSFVSGLAVIAILHLVNPDAMIATANIGHAKTGIAFDANYIMTLSTDAIPSIVKNIDGLPADTQKLIAGKLTAECDGAWKRPWQSYNLSRDKAFHAVNDNLPKLRKMAKGDQKNVE